MIAQFPLPYPDELLYSRLCRYHIRSGHIYARDSCIDLYGTPRMYPNYEFLNRFTVDALHWICGERSLRDVIMSETMFPVYGRFVPRERRERALSLLLSMECGWYNALVMSTTYGKRTLRYCPRCAAEDREQYGETYWHRVHQIPRITACPVHGCRLVESGIVIQFQQTRNFFEAETFARKKLSPMGSEMEILLARYAADVMNAPMPEDSSGPAEYLQARLMGTKYISESGLRKEIKLLHADYAEHFSGLDVIDSAGLGQLFYGTRFDFTYFCQIGEFLGISPTELATMPGKHVSEGRRIFYAQLSDKYGVPLDTVESMGTEILSFFCHGRYVSRKAEYAMRKHEALDKKMFPIIKQCVDELTTSKERPVKISVYGITKRLGIPDRQLQTLPQCLAYVKAHIVSQPEHWARSAEWAIRELQNNSTSVTVGHICLKLNIRRQQFELCVPFLSESTKRLLNIEE